MNEVLPAIWLNLREIGHRLSRSDDIHQHAGYWCNLLNRQLKNLEAYSPMAKNTRNTNPSSSTYVQPKFANIRLGKSDKAEFDAWKATQSDGGYSAITDFTQDGYKTSFTMDKDGNSFIASTTCSDSSNPNSGFCLVSHAPTWLDAILLNVYKTDVFCNDGIWADQDDDEKWG